MADKNIDDVFAEILKDCKAVAVEVVKNAAKKTQNDIIKEADNYLQRYYNNYKPKKYKRTYQLHKSIIPVFKDKTKGGSISIEVGVEYNSSMLKGLYKSNSRFLRYLFWTQQKKFTSILNRVRFQERQSTH